MGLREIVIDGENWIRLAQECPIASFCENSNEPSDSVQKAGYYLTSWVTINFSKNILHHGISKYRKQKFAII
jgi:hypothetical protein